MCGAPTAACCARPADAAFAACRCISKSSPAHCKGQEAAAHSTSLPGTFAAHCLCKRPVQFLLYRSVARLHAVRNSSPAPAQVQAVAPETKQLEDSYALPGKPAYESVPHMYATCLLNVSMCSLCCAWQRDASSGQASSEVSTLGWRVCAGGPRLPRSMRRR